MLNLWSPHSSAKSIEAFITSTKPFPKGDGKLRLYNYHLGEIKEITLRQDGQVQASELKKANYILRSRDNSEVAEMDIRLLDLLDHLQDRFSVDTVEIISGYRRKALNQKLLKKGRQVSPRSLHTQARAIDFHMDEIREETLRDYLHHLELGGVGYYGALDFIHIDTGKYRTWGGSKKFAKKLVGILDPKAPIQLTSDRGEYLPGDHIYFTWNFKTPSRWEHVETIKLQRFWRGKWISCPPQKLSEQNSTLPSTDLYCPIKEAKSPYGKYRWTFNLKGKQLMLSSNEFYLKRE